MIPLTDDERAWLLELLIRNAAQAMREGKQADPLTISAMAKIRWEETK